MKKIIKHLLEVLGKSMSEFSGGEELLNWLFNNVEEFGKLIIDDMSEWAGEDAWIEETEVITQ
ncbi:MAG: hypothetical protein GY938_16810 [Ketobacter sp.]|nr:hypothetical protein [Ketobacter sp.]